MFHVNVSIVVEQLDVYWEIYNNHPNHNHYGNNCCCFCIIKMFSTIDAFHRILEGKVINKLLVLVKDVIFMD